MKIRNVLGVCAGNGVCLYPFEKSKNFNVVGNIEPRGVFYDKEQLQWKSNFGATPQSRTFIEVGKVDIIIGHPDCGDSSILRMSRAKVKGNVKENHSINLFLESIHRYKPKTFLLENLEGFLLSYSHKQLEKYFSRYNLHIYLGSVSNFGNSQLTRKRLILIGIKKSLGNILIEFPQCNRDALSFSESFELGAKEDEQVCHVREPIHKTCNLYLPPLRKLTYKTVQIEWLKRGTPRWFVGGKMKNQPGVNLNLPGQYPSTVRKQNRQFGSLGLVLSPREMANIQGVSSSFNLIFINSNRIYWINKGRLTVTKTMPMEIATWFLKQCKKLKKL